MEKKNIRKNIRSQKNVVSSYEGVPHAGVLHPHILSIELSHLKQINIMGSLLYIIAVILVIGWLIGFVGYGAGGLIHILLVIAIIAILFRIISGRRAL